MPFWQMRRQVHTVNPQYFDRTCWCLVHNHWENVLTTFDEHSTQRKPWVSSLFQCLYSTGPSWFGSTCHFVGTYSQEFGPPSPYQKFSNPQCPALNNFETFRARRSARWRSMPGTSWSTLAAYAIRDIDLITGEASRRSPLMFSQVFSDRWEVLMCIVLTPKRD